MLVIKETISEAQMWLKAVYSIFIRNRFIGTIAIRVFRNYIIYVWPFKYFFSFPASRCFPIGQRNY